MCERQAGCASRLPIETMKVASFKSSEAPPSSRTIWQFELIKTMMMHVVMPMLMLMMMMLMMSSCSGVA